MCLAIALLRSPCACRRYGEAESYDNMAPEMRSYYEDWVILAMGPDKFAKMWKTVGVLVIVVDVGPGVWSLDHLRNSAAHRLWVEG